MRALVLAGLLCAFPSLAWDGNQNWEASTSSPSSGGGGIWGTGGKQDYAITCAHCHMDPSGTTDLTLTFTPALTNVGGTDLYKPGQSYSVTARMAAEVNNANKVGCGQYMAHTNGFAVAFENGSGARAGQYVTDSGLTSASCASTVQPPNLLPGTTFTYGRCHAVTSNNKENLTQWTFTWIAPAAGSGMVTAFWGVVDGNCDMMSMRDAVKTGTKTLGEGAAAAPGSRFPGRLLAALLGAVGLGLVLRRRIR